MKYSIVIPTYNNCEKFLKPCIDSIIRHTKMSDVELIVSANGCTDNTSAYLSYLETAIPNLLVVWSDAPLGFAKAVNAGINVAITDKIILLNNDTVLLDQPKNQWLERLDNGDICSVLTQHSKITDRQFCVFFCTLINRKVFDSIGLLNEEYETGGCEDIEFCFNAENAGFALVDCGWKGDFPIYHAAEGTMYDPALVQDWSSKFKRNELRLAKKVNLEHYRYLLSNNYERAVFLKNDPIFPRETLRYTWASQNLEGTKILEIGCSTGYGIQFLPRGIDYTGLDYDPIIVEVAQQQQWGYDATFVNADINTYPLAQYDTIIAFEVIEHLDNGLELVEKLKQHCKKLLITVPLNEPKGFWGEHHKLHGLNESHFPGFMFNYINEHGVISESPEPIASHNTCNLMICSYENPLFNRD